MRRLTHALWTLASRQAVTGALMVTVGLLRSARVALEHARDHALV